MKILKESSDYLETKIVFINNEISEITNKLNDNKNRVEALRKEKYDIDLKIDAIKTRMDAKKKNAITALIIISIISIVIYSINNLLSIILFILMVLLTSAYSFKGYGDCFEVYQIQKTISKEKANKIEEYEIIIHQLHDSLTYLTKKSNDYSKGLIGEKRVTEMLKNFEYDDCYLINDITLDKAFGNIDHIFISKYGIFIIETKNWDGEIKCNGDNWSRHYEDNLFNLDINSISKRIKGNARNLRLLVETNLFKNLMTIWIEGIIVFTNTDAEIRVINPAVPVITIDEIASYIKRQRCNNTFSSRDLESIANFILKIAND